MDEMHDRLAGLSQDIVDGKLSDPRQDSSFPLSGLRTEPLSLFSSFVLLVRYLLFCGFSFSVPLQVHCLSKDCARVEGAKLVFGDTKSRNRFSGALVDVVAIVEGLSATPIRDVHASAWYVCTGHQRDTQRKNSYVVETS